MRNSSRLSARAAPNATEEAEDEQARKTARKRGWRGSVTDMLGKVSRIHPDEDGGSFRPSYFGRKSKREPKRRSSILTSFLRRSIAETRRPSTATDKASAASASASRRHHLLTSVVRRLSLVDSSKQPAPNAYTRYSVVGEAFSAGCDRLELELNRLLDAEGLTLAEAEPLPELMRRDCDFGLSSEAATLDANQFDLWRERVAAWLRTTLLMRDTGTVRESTKLEAEGMQRLDSLVQLLQRCSSVTELRLTNCVISNTTLTSVCQLMKERLLSLDLSGTLGFDDTGLKALAAYCTKVRAPSSHFITVPDSHASASHAVTPDARPPRSQCARHPTCPAHQVQTLRLAGCTVTDAGFGVVAKHCKSLKVRP